MGRRGSYWWGSCFGRCSRVEDVPSPRPSVTSPSLNAHRKEQKSPNTRISYSDASTAELSSLSSSLLTANLGTFTVSEMKTATKAFAASNFIGEGGFGPVYKGFMEEKSRAAGGKTQAVAVKVLNLEGLQGHKEWLTEVIMLGQLRHPHLVKLIGYCYEDKHRMLVYEFMARGSLENHLFKGFSPLSWKKRINIALGAAKGLAFLHGVDQPVIYRDFKASNILLDSDHKAKLSDFGLAKDGPEDGETHVSTRVMGTHGYAAPEYIMTGHLTAKSDVYSFGVVLLELLTGRRSVDKARPSREQNLVDWAKPYLNNPRKLDQMMDPLLEGQYSIKGAQKAAELAYQCLNHLPKSRPHMCAVVDLLEPIVDYCDIPPSTFVFTVKDCNGKAKIDAKSPKEETVEKPRKPTKEDGHLRGKTPGSEGHKVNAARRNARRAHRHNRGSSKTAHSDTALYRKTPKQQHRNRGI